MNPKCPKCGAEMTGGAPHGPWPIQYECRFCGTIFVPAKSIFDSSVSKTFSWIREALQIREKQLMAIGNFLLRVITMSMYRPNGDRVHCGEVLRIRVNGAWQWGRFEMGSRGEGYFIVNNERCYNLDQVQAIDYEAVGGQRIGGKVY